MAVRAGSLCTFVVALDARRICAAFRSRTPTTGRRKPAHLQRKRAVEML
jgi:hypothetical protein